MFTLEIENFQIYENIKLEFKPGKLIAITGPSNSGKSALLRSIETLFLNPSANSEDICFINDSHFMRVIVTVNANRFSYMRNPDGVEYEVNSTVYNKIGRSNLFNLSNNIPLVLDENENILNVQGEWNFMFPFDRKDTGLFKLFEDIFAIIDSNHVIKEFNSQQQNLKSEIVIIENKQNRIIQQENLINQFLQIPDFNYKKLNELNNKINKLKNIKRFDLKKLNIINQINTEKIIKLVTIINNNFNKINKIDPNIKLINTKKTEKLNRIINNFIYKEINKLNTQNKIDPNKIYKINKLNQIKDIKDINKINIFNHNLLTKSNNLKKLEIFNNVSLIQQKKLYNEITDIVEKKNNLILIKDQMKICPVCNQEIKGNSN